MNLNYSIEDLKTTYCTHFSSCDVIYLSSSLGLLGSISNSLNIRSGSDLARIHLDIIFDVLTSSQTLLIPGFTYSFSHAPNKISLFSLSDSPPLIGDLPLSAFASGMFSRSIDPFLSIFVYGPATADLITDLPFTSYGVDSIFERLRSLSTRVVSVGLGEHWLPFMHYADFLSKTPFRYPKNFIGDIITPETTLTSVNWTYDVRLPIQNTYPHTYKLASMCTPSADSIYSPLGRSSVFSFDYSIALEASLPIIQRDPWISVVGPPLSRSEVQIQKCADVSKIS